MKNNRDGKRRVKGKIGLLESDQGLINKQIENTRNKGKVFDIHIKNTYRKIIKSMNFRGMLYIKVIFIEFLESYKCDSLEEARGKVKELKYNSMGPFSFKIFKDDEVVE